MRIKEKFTKIIKRVLSLLDVFVKQRCYNNPSQTYLFVGGTKDGEIMHIPNDKYRIHLPNEHYYKEIIYNQRTCLVIYVHESIDSLSVLDKLIGNYTIKNLTKI